MVDIEKSKIEIGERIKSIRNNMGMSQKDFSKLIGMKTQYLCNVEKGNSGLTVEKIIEICNKTEISSDYLIFGINNLYVDEIKTKFSKYSTDEINLAFEIVKNTILLFK